MRVGFLGLCFVSFGVPAQSAKAKSIDTTVGAFLGPSFLNDNLGTTAVYGVRVGWKFDDSFSLGFMTSHQSLYTFANTYGDSLNISDTVFAVEMNYYPAPEVPIYIGAKLGMSIISGTIYSSYSNTLYNTGDSHADFAFGPALGFDIPTAPNFSMGGEFGAIFVRDSNSNLTMINATLTGSFHF